jgi:serine protease Do
VTWSQDGQVITNAHVVEGAGSSGSVEVELWDGRHVPGRIIKNNGRDDLSALQIEASGLPAATPGDSNALRIGELVVAVGNPLGFIGAASMGVIHRLNWSHGFQDRSWVVSHVRLAPGNSGGPLANARGGVVGINTMVAGGLAFAIPSHTVVQFLRAPRKAPGRLGVTVRPVSLNGSGRQLGFILLEVIPGSPAQSSSLRQGDMLVSVGGHGFRSVQDLEMAIRASREGLLQLQFRRGASENIRSVAIQIAAPSLRAA